MEKVALKDVAAALGLAWQGDESISGICTDTRMLEADCLFVAIKGDRFDGHNFAKKAIEGGAIAVLGQKDMAVGQDKQLIVDDSRKALMKIAAWYRRRFDLKVVAITGSVGKTTSKEMTAAVLSKKYKTLKNRGNLNNEIGLPMTVFGLDSSFEAAVLEMGMSDLGEIERLSEMAKPHIGVLTNIGVAHIENLGSRENILLAKSEILKGMDKGSSLLLNADDKLLMTIDPGEYEIISFGIEEENCDFRAVVKESVGNTASFDIIYEGKIQALTLPTLGRHNIYNALSAFAVGVKLGVSPEDAALALAEYKPAGMRQRIRQVQGFTFIEDCYNSSPDSLLAALDVLNQYSSKRRIAVLGDMLELGQYSDRAHCQAGEAVAKNSIDILLTYGSQSRKSAERARELGVKTVMDFDSKNDLADKLLKLLLPGDTVLFKASRGMRLEDVIDILYGELGTNE
ncbi:MAG: UDP-N-acetylmuramoyl-tripeptide--D-alanyl-D-alanine ligase [Clostridiales bacterium]|nr:UDP-N-acetylmuramoyl-tripeptide--D-alanyl-D-alanine ligase [Clostridiales bacterium]